MNHKSNLPLSIFTQVVVATAVLTPNVFAKDVLEEIKVTAHPLATDGLAQSTKVLKGEELDQAVQGSLGETVSNVAGIQSASFGTAVGRPVIHGLGGARVKTTEDRIDSLDVSVTSTDHAVTLEPFIADQINVFRGASTLVYGTGAIGGVVDVETGRIPKRLPEKLEGRVELRAADNADATVAVARLDGAVGNIAWHLDAFDRDADDYDIPGFVESFAQRALEEAEEEGHGDEEHGEEEEERDILEGSFSRNRGVAGGFSFVGENGFIGMSLSTLDAEYGLVGGHGHEEEGEEEGEEHSEEEEEAPGLIDLEQTRIDIEGQLSNPFSGIESVNFRMGINDYQHAEIEGNGEIGSLFDNKAWEARLQFEHAKAAGFIGSFGIQANSRDFSAIGEEAFIPPVESDGLGVFWLGEREFDAFDLELGFRIEEVTHKPTAMGGSELDFSAASASIGMVAPVGSDWTFSALLDLSSRAPSIEELFSNGPHLATQSFEIGNLALEEESALALTFTSSYQTDWLDFKLTAYAMDFSDFIYQAATGEIDDDLPVFVYQQDDARFLGIDLEAIAHLGVWQGGDVDFEFKADTVDARLDQGGNRNLPRIPASRVAVALSWGSDVWESKLSLTRVASQTDTAVLELPTESYNDVSFYLSRTWSAEVSPITLFLNARNLSDDEQRHHASFVKDFAPAPGRRFEAGIRWRF